MHQDQAGTSLRYCIGHIEIKTSAEMSLTIAAPAAEGRRGDF
jgi:hypothetical protein